MRVIVTGATGYVGRSLTPQLEKLGHEVAQVVRQESHALGTCRLVYDGNRPQALEQFFMDWRPDAVTHLAASVKKDDSQETILDLINSNVLLTTQLAGAAVRSACRKFINITTYSTSVDGKTYFPQTLYAASKKAGEDILQYFHQTCGLMVCNLALYDVYGPNQPHSRFIPALVESIKKGQLFEMTEGQQEICLVYIADVVDGIIHALRDERLYDGPVPQRFSIHGPEKFRLMELPGKIASIASIASLEVRHTKPYRKNEIMNFAPLSKLLPGWSPKVTLHEGIKSLLT